MCGIAGIIYRNGNGGRPLGADMTRMLQSMKHRGPDSTGYALYGPASDLVLVRFWKPQSAKTGAQNPVSHSRR
jgi:glutamate synthase domain-containing protein 1